MASSLSSPDLVSVARWIQENWPTLLVGTGLGTGLLLLLGFSRTARTGAFRAIQIVLYGVGAAVIMVGVLYHCARRAAAPVLPGLSPGADDDGGQGSGGHPVSEADSDEASPQGPHSSLRAGSPPAAAVPSVDLLLSGAGCGEAAGVGPETLDGGVLPAGGDQGDVAASHESLPCPSGFRHWVPQLQGDSDQSQGQGGGEMELDLL